jgi:uncharacterized cupin superfamily protein
MEVLQYQTIIDKPDTALQHELGIDVKIFDGNKQQVTDFQFQSVTTFRSKFPVSCSKAHQKYNRSATAWVLLTVQTCQTLKDIRTHPNIAQELCRLQSRMIHHQFVTKVHE